jgi:hypothetical protein
VSARPEPPSAAGPAQQIDPDLLPLLTVLGRIARRLAAEDQQRRERDVQAGRITL